MRVGKVEYIGQVVPDQVVQEIAPMVIVAIERCSMGHVSPNRGNGAAKQIRRRSGGPDGPSVQE